MIKKSMCLAMLLSTIGSAAWAQATSIQVTGLFGYTASDGVNGSARVAGDGSVYNQVAPKDSANVGFSVGYMATANVEVGFMYRRQFSTLNIYGPNASKDIGDLDIDGYHGYFTFYLGEPEAKVNLYFMGGAGATHLTAVSYTRSTGQGALTRAGTEFSTTWGSGLRYNAATHFALKAGVSWTPTYIKSNAVGWWCDPWWGCYVVGNAQYMNQIHFEGGVVIRY